jgi:hypothetical protein
MDAPLSDTADRPKIIVEPPHIHIDVHVHLDGSVGVAPVAEKRDSPYREFDPRSAAGEASKRSLLTSLVVAAGVLAVGYGGYHAGRVSSARQASPASVAAAAQPHSAPASLPESLSRELQQLPQITPPPGAATNSSAPSGPASFGLHE